MKNRVLHCIATLGGGGAERQLCYLVKGLVGRGWDVHVAILKGGVNYERLRESGATIHILSSRSNYDFKIFYQLIKIIKSENPSLIQCWQHPFDFFGCISALCTGKRFMSVERTSPGRYANSLKGLLRLFVVQFSSAVVSNSVDGKIFWQKRLIKNIPNIVIPNIIPFDELPGNRTTNSNYIIAVGRLSEEKNFERLIEAMQIVNESLKQFQLFIYGTGPGHLKLKEAISSRGLDNVVLLKGYKENVWECILNAQLFVSVSLFEGMPNAVLEAAALGTPMLLSKISAHQMSFNDEAATFVDPNDGEGMALRIKHILENPGPAQEKANIAKIAVQPFSQKIVTESYINIYNQVIQNDRIIQDS